MRLGYNHKTAIIAALLFLVAAFVFIRLKLLLNSQQSKVLGDSSDVQISAYIPITGMRFRVFPEKRIPRIGNWATIADVTLVNCNDPTKVYQFNSIPTDSQGYGSVTFTPDVYTFDGPYRVYIRGFSHLNRSFNCYNIVQSNTLIDLTLEGKELLAGETSVIYDNYINALDLSTMVKKMFTTDYKNDLNQDGKVNSLDMANQIFNFYTHGDTP
jgi:hypothetical protein